MVGRIRKYADFPKFVYLFWDLGDGGALFPTIKKVFLGLIKYGLYDTAGIA